MSKYWIIGLLLLGCVSCDKGYESIPQEQMIDILTDMYVSDQIAREYPLEIRDSVSNILMQNLLKVHKVSKSQLDTNLYLYQLDLEGYKVMSDSVLNRITRLKEQAESKDIDPE